MTPFIMGGKNKRDTHAARLSKMSERIDALRAEVTTTKDRDEELRRLVITVDRQSAAFDVEQRRNESATKKLEAIRKQLLEQLAQLDCEVSQLRTDLFDRNSQIAGLTAQLSSLRATVDTLQKRRWWQWR